MRSLAAELGVTDCVHFTGRVSDEQLRSYLSAADVCVDPDPLNEFSNASTMNKIVEYMSLGKPIIAFDLLEHRRSALEAALYIEPNDVAQFARGVHELLGDIPKRERMSKFAKERFQHTLSWEMSEENLLRAYSELLDAINFVPATVPASKMSCIDPP